MITTVKVKFRPSTVKDRADSIVCLVTHRRIVRHITTGYKIFPEERDGRQSKVIPFYNERAEIIRQIAQKLARDMKRLDAVIAELSNDGNLFTADDVVRIFQKAATGHSFFSVLWMK